MIAHCLIREAPWYRRDAFTAGLKAAGMEVLMRPPDNANRNTVLVIWNRYATGHDIAKRVERAGGTVLVAENGYVGRGGVSPKFDVHPAGPKPDSYYALGQGYHNSVEGVVTPPAESDAFASRWPALGVELKPLRRREGYILVCPNRSFGVPGRMMHPDWAEQVVARLSKQTKRRVMLRRHPGNDAPKRPLAADLEGAWAVVVWSSTAGLHAMIEGVPVICEAPHWIGMRGALRNMQLREAMDGDDIEGDRLREAWAALRLLALRTMSWGQWTCDELRRGDPFRHMLPAAR